VVWVVAKRRRCLWGSLSLLEELLRCGAITAQMLPAARNRLRLHCK